MKEKRKENNNLKIDRVCIFEKNSKKVGVDAITVNIRGNDRLYVGVRELYQDGDEWKPSEKGCTFDSIHIGNLIDAVNSAKEFETYPESHPLAFIPKNSTEEVQVGLKNYMNSEYLDIRIFYKKEDMWHPSRKGVTIPPECLDDLLSGLLKFKEQFLQEV